MDCEQAWRRLAAPPGFHAAQDARAVADAFETSLASGERSPEQHVEFLCRVLSDPALVNRPGLEYLVMAFQADRARFTAGQLRRFADTAVDRFGLVQREVFALALCDFIARALPPDASFEALSDMTALARTPQSLSGVFFGLDILWREAGAPGAEPTDPDRPTLERAARVAELRLLHLKRRLRDEPAGPPVEASS